ncbi:hypothetical protein EPUS_00236 [Endocarpon pusillum Z07020]|uniref:Uncharacterized protein n=1 Tax=Endocarpon pusillum (strain Z07020 / HMAS-L-300199) TaxID=1263415 RepID=U1GSR1_ENDPU|nr:uncharacterized protein EPUS_00236 [Endocarpon pusillum Z07020]ERF75443.1 hypothetical protein EPUS_00236 [Endocarpon pusillum Z07020]
MLPRVSGNTVSQDESEAFLRLMNEDSTIYIWTLKYIEAEETKVAPRFEATQRLRALIDTRVSRRTGYLEALAHSVRSDPRNVALIDISMTQMRNHEQALTLGMIITTPSRYLGRSFRHHLEGRMHYRVQLREDVNWMLGLPILSERQRSRATGLLSECTAYADGPDPFMQLATRAPPSERPSRRHDGSSEERATPRGREDRAQAPKAPKAPKVSNQQGTATAPPYPRGDLIDLVASKKASTNQTRNFHSQAVHDEAFHQQAMERLEIYSAASEEKKHKKLRAVLEGVKNDRMKLTTAASSRQTGQTGEEGGQSSGSPAPKQPAASTRPVPSLTREEKLAQEYRQNLDRLNRHIEELERDSEIKSLSQVSAELKLGIRTMRLQGMQQLATTKRALIGQDGAGAPRGTAEAIEAVERIPSKGKGGGSKRESSTSHKFSGNKSSIHVSLTDPAEGWRPKVNNCNGCGQGEVVNRTNPNDTQSTIHHFLNSESDRLWCFERYATTNSRVHISESILKAELKTSNSESEI